MSKVTRHQLWADLRQVLGIRVGSGLGLPASMGDVDTDIETLLVEAAANAAVHPLIAELLATWVCIHGARVRTEKLHALATAEPVSHFWLAVLAHLAVSRGYAKWRLLARKLAESALRSQPRLLVEMADATENEEWLIGCGLKVPVGALRIRREDVLSVEELAIANLQYRLRLQYGADVRADVAYAIARGVTASSEIAKLVHCSREAAGRIAGEIMTAVTAGATLPSYNQAP
ncbi:MAG: hypothetical protein FJ146_14120 [Deltaproteobacteria bacterium]|nr:hypothetical protein [Deltaproteobacteria bacterium]